MYDGARSLNALSLHQHSKVDGQISIDFCLFPLEGIRTWLLKTDVTEVDALRSLALQLALVKSIC